MTATAFTPASRPLPVVFPAAESSYPLTKPLQIITPPTAASAWEPAVLTRLPRRAQEGLVVTGTGTRSGAHFAWLLDGTAATGEEALATAVLLADLQEVLREQLARRSVLESVAEAEAHLLARAAGASAPISAALLRQEAGVLEVAVLGTAGARMHRHDGRTRTVVCRRPRRGVLETIGVSVAVAVDPRDGRPTEVEVHRRARQPRAAVPVLSGDPHSTARPGYGVSAAHLLASVELRTGRGIHHALSRALDPAGRADPRKRTERDAAPIAVGSPAAR